MFGTRRQRDLQDLERLVSRERPLGAFKHLAANLGAGGRSAVLNTSAVCLDTCVMIHLSKHPKADTILDYFASIHAGILVVSAQSLQEFWNNHVFAIETVAAGVAKKFAELEKELRKLDPSWSSFPAEVGDVLRRLKEEYGHLHDPKTRARLSKLADQLAERAVIEEVPRSRFAAHASHRKMLKTPPGFEDDGHGDYFIWLDFLFSIRSMREKTMSSAIMVTDDTKRDWSKGAVPHPVLAAEMESYTGLALETWTLERLWREIESNVAGRSEASDIAPSDPAPPTV